MNLMQYFKKSPPKSWWTPILVTALICLLGSGISELFFLLLSAFLNNSSSQSVEIIYSLFSFSFILCGVFFWNKVFNHRTIKSLGFTTDKLIERYCFGFGLGGLAVSLVILPPIIFSSIAIRANHKIDYLFLFLLLIGFIIQGLTEEVLCRGYLQNSVAAMKNETWGILVSAFIFALMHGLNPNIEVLPLINLFLFGLVFSLIYKISENILFVGAIHSAWNFFQGPIWGIEVSGQDFGTSFFLTNVSTPSLLNGGAFGIEGSILATLLGIGCCIYCYFYIKDIQK